MTDFTSDGSRIFEKLDKLEHMLERLSDSSGATGDSPRPLTKQARRREQGLTHLYRSPKSGIFYWRRIDEFKGRRVARSTKTADESIAILIGAKFEHEYQRRRAGLGVYDSYAKPLVPATEHWIKSLNVTDEVRDMRAMQIGRALKLLKLSTFADLDDISRLERNLLALEGTPGGRGLFNRLTLVRTFQCPLKQFAKWAARNRRYLPVDPLADWELLRIPETLPRRLRRAASPAEIARTLLAAEALDRIHRRPNPTAIFFSSLLVTGSRFGALQDLDVSGLLRDRSRLNLGPNVGKKRRGEASLDARTLLEVTAYVGDRTSGPLFLNTEGGRLEHNKALNHWRESFRFALVDELWPDGTPRTLELVHHVERVLSSGRVPSVGGNPRRLRAETVKAREEYERQVRDIAEHVREPVEARMEGIDLHALRKTHRTWAEAAGVHPILIDKQIGHATSAGGAALDMARALIVSPTGRKHYVDLGLEMIDARRSAEAVRKLVDDAKTALLTATAPSVFSPVEKQTADVIAIHGESRVG
jgi:integrase